MKHALWCVAVLAAAALFALGASPTQQHLDVQKVESFVFDGDGVHDLSIDVSPALRTGFKVSDANIARIDRGTIDAAIDRAKTRLNRMDPTDKRMLIAEHVAGPSSLKFEPVVEYNRRVSAVTAIQAENATSLRAHFSVTPAALGATILVYSDLDPTPRKVRSGFLLGDKDGIWGPRVEGQTMFIEILGGKNLKNVVVDTVAYGLPVSLITAGSCNLDVTCYSAYNDLKTAVGRYSFEDGGSYLCTGQMVADQQGTGRLFFLTANHCLNDQDAAETMEVYWNYETTSCNGSAPSLFTLPRSSGADHKVSGFASDFTLVELYDAPPNGTVFLGWTTADLGNSEDVTAIHHPGGSYKRISFGHEVSDENTHWRVTWDQGTTEGGSSGSVLFNDDDLLVGQLHRGSASCTNQSGWDEYGKFGNSYVAGLSDYLGDSPVDDDDDTTPPDDDDDSGGGCGSSADLAGY
ncbi:MAG: trypsin-like peptidase domain-containing protein [Myxococcales bacterium]|nr:trypsin-like peptidase domain-containing protein [Myxococcales bacterium]